MGQGAACGKFVADPAKPRQPARVSANSTRCGSLDHRLPLKCNSARDSVRLEFGSSSSRLRKNSVQAILELTIAQGTKRNRGPQMKNAERASAPPKAEAGAPTQCLFTQPFVWSTMSLEMSVNPLSPVLATVPPLTFSGSSGHPVTAFSE